MKATRNYVSQAEEEVAPVDISSLIDVCFLLLIYFLVTATIMPRESDLDLQLPGPGVNQPVDDLVIRLNLEETGVVSMAQESGSAEVLDTDGDSRSLPLLKDRINLMQMAAAPNDLLVQIDVEEEASHQRFIDVMNCLSEMEVGKVSFIDHGEDH
ncbi:MAG: biopolymer transport protein ExbD [Crocinitomicaceae bacterium]|jgi:biopolymer transport protein ExbD